MIRGFIIGTVSLNSVDFQFMPTIKQSRNLNAPNIPVVGANNSVLQATGGSNEITLETGFYVKTKTGLDVIDNLRRLEAFTYRDIEPVRIVIGDLFKNRLFILTGLEFEKHLLNPRNGYPQAAKVNIRAKEIRE